MSYQIVAPAAKTCPKSKAKTNELSLVKTEVSTRKRRWYHTALAFLRVTGIAGLAWLVLNAIDKAGTAYAAHTTLQFIPALPGHPSTVVLMLMTGNVAIVTHAAMTMPFWWPFLPLTLIRAVAGDVFEYQIVQRSIQFAQEHRQPVSRKVRFKLWLLRHPWCHRRYSALTTACQPLAKACRKIGLNKIGPFMQRQVERVRASHGLPLLFGLFLLKLNPLPFVPLPPAAVVAGTTSAKRWHIAVTILLAAITKTALMYCLINSL